MITSIGKTFEGTVENGLIRLSGGVILPDKAKVYVTVPGAVADETAHIRSPRLVHPEQAMDFVKQVVECCEDARV